MPTKTGSVPRNHSARRNHLSRSQKTPPKTPKKLRQILRTRDKEKAEDGCCAASSVNTYAPESNCSRTNFAYPASFSVSQGALDHPCNLARHALHFWCGIHTFQLTQAWSMRLVGQWKVLELIYRQRWSRPSRKHLQHLLHHPRPISNLIGTTSEPLAISSP